MKIPLTLRNTITVHLNAIGIFEWSYLVVVACNRFFTLLMRWRFLTRTGSVTRKKLPNFYQICPNMISLEKLKILPSLHKLPKNVGDLGKSIVAKCFKKFLKLYKSPNLVTLKTGHVKDFVDKEVTSNQPRSKVFLWKIEQNSFKICLSGFIFLPNTVQYFKARQSNLAKSGLSACLLIILKAWVNVPNTFKNF